MVILFTTLFVYCYCYNLDVLLCGGSCLLQKCKIEYSPNFVGMLWSALLLSMHTIITRLFRIMACKHIGEAHIHYYFGVTQCFDGMWFMSVAWIFVIVIFWIIIWFKLFSIGPQNRYKPSSWNLQSIISPYKCTKWYWEFVLLSRRFIISGLVTFKYWDENYINLVLGISLVFYLLLHLTLRPFKHKRINNMESLCLFLLICCFTLINFSLDDLFMCTFITIALLFPLLIYVTRIYSTIKLYCSLKRSDGQLDSAQQNKLFKVVNRLPPDQRELIRAIIHKTMPHITVPPTEVK